MSSTEHQCVSRLDLDLFEAAWLLQITEVAAYRRARDGALPGAWRDPSPDGTPNAVGEWRVDIETFRAALRTTQQLRLLDALSVHEISVVRPATRGTSPSSLWAVEHFPARSFKAVDSVIDPAAKAR